MEYRDILKTARTNRGYTQEHLAKLSGLNQALISRIENGLVPDDDARKKIGAILHETEGAEAPAGISQMLTMKLNEEGKKVNEEVKNAPQESAVSELTRAIVERDIYKRLYDELLAKVISR